MLEVNISQYKSTCAEWLPRFLLQHQRHEDQSSSCPIEVRMPVMLLASHSSLVAPQIRSWCSSHSDPIVDGNLFTLFLQKRQSRSALNPCLGICKRYQAPCCCTWTTRISKSNSLEVSNPWNPNVEAFPPRWKPRHSSFCSLNALTVTYNQTC